MNIPLSDKSALRIMMKKQRSSIPQQIRYENDKNIATKITSSDIFKNAKCIFCYSSFGDEISTDFIIDKCLSDNKILCIPKTIGNGLMKALKISSKNDLICGKYNIYEPDIGCQEILPTEIDLCIIPCLAADKNCNRLGYGGGYYDRFLAKTSAVKAVLCYEQRLFDKIHTENTDVSCDIVVTESRVICAR